MRSPTDQKMKERLERCHQWYEVRFRRLRDLVQTLPEDVQKAYWNIVANGVASTHELPLYDGRMNLLRHERDQETKRAGDLEAMLSRMIRVTRKTDDPKVVAAREQAKALLHARGRTSALRGRNISCTERSS